MTRPGRIAAKPDQRRDLLQAGQHGPSHANRPDSASLIEGDKRSPRQVAIGRIANGAQHCEGQAEPCGDACDGGTFEVHGDRTRPSIQGGFGGCSGDDLAAAIDRACGRRAQPSRQIRVTVPCFAIEQDGRRHQDCSGRQCGIEAACQAEADQGRYALRYQPKCSGFSAGRKAATSRNDPQRLCDPCLCG